jgi:hypothetical protein
MPTTSSCSEWERSSIIAGPRIAGRVPFQHGSRGGWLGVNGLTLVFAATELRTFFGAAVTELSMGP